MAISDEIKLIWKNAEAVTFDVDSTVIKTEGIDELATFCGKGDEVATLTSQAMQGNVTYRQSLRDRLNIIQPNHMQINQYLSSCTHKLSPRIDTLVEALQAHKKEVFLVSGGFHCMIQPLAQLFHIPLGNIFANKLKFYYTGEYAGFDETQPTSENGGKTKIIEYLKEKRGYKTVVHIGDGVTDLETLPVVDLFIGYGGNVVRKSVQTDAQWFITDFKELIDNLGPLNS